MNAPNSLRELKNNDFVGDISKPGVLYEKRPVRWPDGSVAPGLFNAWITLDNPTQYNSYTTDMVKGVRRADTAAIEGAVESPLAAARLARACSLAATGVKLIACISNDRNG